MNNRLSPLFRNRSWLHLPDYFTDGFISGDPILRPNHRRDWPCRRRQMFQLRRRAAAPGKITHSISYSLRNKSAKSIFFTSIIQPRNNFKPKTYHTTLTSFDQTKIKIKSKKKKKQRKKDSPFSSLV